jgi:hypothetical protein
MTEGRKPKDDDMKRVFLAAAAALALSACADGGGYGYYPGQTVYYDDAYGPIYDGYWDNDVFFYSTGRDHHYVRDEGHHFRRDAAGGFHGVRTHRGFHRDHDHDRDHHH